QVAGVTSAPQTTPNLPPDSSPFVVTLTVPLPASVQGTNQDVVVTVAPERNEKIVANNTQSTTVAIPKPPPQPAPDLAVTIVRAVLSSDGATLDVDAHVQNVGTATSRPTTVSALAFG